MNSAQTQPNPNHQFIIKQEDVPKIKRLKMICNFIFGRKSISGNDFYQSMQNPKYLMKTRSKLKIVFKVQRMIETCYFINGMEKI